MIKKQLSIVIPMLNEQDVFLHLRETASAFMSQMEDRYEIELIMVDDGSRDETWSLIMDFAEADSRVRGLQLSRNFGHQAALMCGYQAAQGDAILSMDADLQHPVEVFEQMLAAWEDGYDIVHGMRREREDKRSLKHLTSVGFYKFISMMGVDCVRANCSDFRLISRNALDALLGMGDYHMFIRGMVGWLGFKQTDVFYDQQARVAGHTKYTMLKMIRFAVDAIVSFSILPLRLAYGAAFLMLVFVMLYVLCVAGLWLSGSGDLVPGWSSLVVLISLFGSMNLLCIGLLGEYVGKIYEQSKSRPRYILGEDSREVIGKVNRYESRKFAA